MSTVLRWFRVIAFGIVLLGCTDTTGPLAEGEITAASPEVNFSIFESDTELAALIWDEKVEAGFTQSTAYSEASARFFGNRASVEAILDLRDGNTFFPSVSAVESASGLAPVVVSGSARASRSISKQCGHTADAAGKFTAAIEYSLRGEFKISSAGSTRWDHSSQPPCSSSCDTRVIDDPGYGDYDPYNPENPIEPGCDSGGGGSGGGSGTYYHAGDSTGGETVDWSTGQGNGGSSACGDAAVVEYVCIDVWDGEGWREWGCGYVTTC